MKIVFLGNMIPSEVHSLKWAQYFIDKGHSVVKIHSDGFSFRTVWKLRRTIKQFKPDILHAHYAGSWGLMGALTFFHPFVVTIHGSEVLRTKGLKKWFVQWVLKKADVITTDGRHIERKLETEWGIPQAKVKYINFGVDVEKFKPCQGNLFRIIYRSGPDKLYDLDTMRKAIQIVEKRYPGPLFQEIKGIASEKMPYFMGGATIYVSTAFSDAGLSSTTAEAMACGLPVIVTRIADNQLWVNRRFTFKPGDYLRLADLIIDLLHNSDLRSEQGKRNRQMIVEANNYAMEMAKMENFYKEVCNG